MQGREWDWGGIKTYNTGEPSLNLFYFKGIYVHQVNTHWGWCSLVCLPRWHATFWQMWGGRPGAPCGDPGSLKGMWWGGWEEGEEEDVEWSFWWRLCVCVVSYLCKWIIFPLHLAKVKAVPSVTSLLICPTPSHFLLCFKRVIWWQDYIKPTGFLGALLADLSTSLQVHRYLPSSPLASGDSVAHQPHPFPLCLGQGSQIEPLSSEQWFSVYSTESLGSLKDCSRAPQLVKHFPPNNKNANCPGLRHF